MGRFLISIVFVIAFIYLFGFISVSISNYNLENEAKRTPVLSPIPSYDTSPMPSGYPLPTVNTTKQGDNNLIEVLEYRLSFKIPLNWSYKLDESIITIYINGEQKHYLGEVRLLDSEGKVRISIIPNLQGDWCAGPSNIEKIMIPARFGLEGNKYECGDTIYLYGNLEKPGAVIPNLFIDVQTQDQDSDNILSSITYIPTE